jgi:hypothetical protein
VLVVVGGATEGSAQGATVRSDAKANTGVLHCVQDDDVKQTTAKATTEIVEEAQNDDRCWRGREDGRAELDNPPFAKDAKDGAPSGNELIDFNLR